MRTVLFTGWALGDTHGGVEQFSATGSTTGIWGMQGYNDSTPTARRTRSPEQSQPFARASFASARPARRADVASWSSSARRTTTPGASASARKGSSSARRPTATRASTCRSPIATTSGARLVAAACSARSPTRTCSKPITEKVRQVDHHGGYTAAAGHALYTARNYPQEYWNRTAFVCEPTGHLVGDVRLDADGTDFSSTNACNLLASDDEWAAPIMAEVGPDGNVWVIDWYNYIVQHNPTPRRLRDRQGERVRNRPARQTARPHLSRRAGRGGKKRRRTSERALSTPNDESSTLTNETNSGDCTRSD